MVKARVAIPTVAVIPFFILVVPRSKVSNGKFGLYSSCKILWPHVGYIECKVTNWACTEVNFTE